MFRLYPVIYAQLHSGDGTDAGKASGLTACELPREAAN